MSHFCVNPFLQKGNRFIHIGPGEDHKFIATEAGNEILSLAGAAQGGGYFLQRVIALDVAVGVIDLLEVIAVHDEKVLRMMLRHLVKLCG